MIFMCLQLLCYFGVSHRAGMMAVAQGDTSLVMVLLSIEGEVFMFLCLPALLLFLTWYHIVSLRFTTNMEKENK